MNPSETKYAQYSLVKEMMQTTSVIASFSPKRSVHVAEEALSTGKLLLTGEGSSRIFPAKNAIRRAMEWGLSQQLTTEGCHQACLYHLEGFTTLIASNSGRTREALLLSQQLQSKQCHSHFALTAHPDTPLCEHSRQAFILECGAEQAVAATKSVVEQALFCESIVWNMAHRDMAAALHELSDAFHEALTLSIPERIISSALKANTIYLAGWNDGVAEELTLKTNEITRRKSDYLEGTYVLHGIEEVMTDSDLVILIDPIEAEMSKYEAVLKQSAHVNVVAIATRPTPFDTIIVPQSQLQSYVFLAAGWNLLVEIGLALGVDLDKPQRARKIGNAM